MKKKLSHPILTHQSKLLLSKVMENTSFSSIDFKNFVEKWNTKYQFDRWWRKKHSIAFGSEAHLNMSHLWMIVEYREDKFFEALQKNVDFDPLKDENLIVNKAGRIDFGEKKEAAQTQRMTDEEFNNLDITQFNEINNE